MDYRTLSKTPGTGNWRDAQVIIDPPGPPSYLCRMSTVCPKLITLLITLVLLGLVPPGSGTVQGAPASTSEYMIYQYPGVALVVKVDVPEAEFSMRVLGPDDTLLADAGVPGRRLGPVFQYLGPADLPRQLMIEITPGRPLPRSDIVMQVIQLEAGDPNSANLVRAYRQFSTGIEIARGDDTNTWVVKTYSLRNAAEEFAALGMEEMRLWSEYFAAHLVLHRLGDRLMAMEVAQEIQRAAIRAGFSRIELAALLLEGDALLRVMADDGDARSPGFYERTHSVFARIAELAELQQLAGEQGRALYNSGRVLERQGRDEEALDAYGQALAVGAGAGDPDLLNEMRNASAALQESLGRTAGAIEMLDQVAAELEEGQRDDAQSELAEGLFEKGRLLNSNYRYGEAAVALARALELWKGAEGSEPWGPTGLELAWSLYSMGNADGAASLIRESLSRTPLQGNRDLLARAYGSLARSSLARGEYEEAAEARERQAELTGDGPPRARLLFSMATDARLRFGPGSAEAERLLQRSRQAAVAVGDRLAEQRCGLQICLLAVERGQADACSDAEIAASYTALRESGVPTLAAEAGFARSSILRGQGRSQAAWQEMNGLLEDIYWLRQALPGVLGAWYAEHRGSIVRDYVGLSFPASGESLQAGSIGMVALLALERVRMLEAMDFARADGRYLDAESEEQLRNLLAGREAAAAVGSPNLAAEARQALDAARRKCRQCGGPGRGLITADELESLVEGIGSSEAVLAYDLSGTYGRALLVHRGGVRAINLPRTSDILDILRELRGASGRATAPASQARLESLGRLLLAPFADTLPPRVYLLPLGPLQGFPFDALRWGGEFLVEGHQVVNLAGLSSLANRGPVMEAGFRERVFLAGDPRGERDPFSLEVVVSPEVAAVTDVFVGPGLHVVQGLALQKDEFQDDRFTRAALIHLAAPGKVDLTYPEQSYLRLSGSVDPDAGSNLTPAEVRDFELVASLVVLSGTAVAGETRSPVDSRMALVSDFLDAGAASVLLSLWPLGEANAASFATEFYRNLEREPDIESAFTMTRRSRIESGAATNLDSWAGFQLFIR
jgi:CHAT domain-containing protein/tetratricopeptide (TPR) repeat protein